MNDQVPRWLQVAGAWAWRIVAIALALWVLAQAFVILRVIIIAAVVALFAATALWPVVERLRRAGLPSLAATWLTFVSLAAVLVGLGFLLGPRVADELESLGPTLGEATSQVEGWLADGPLGLSRDQVDEAFDRLGETLRSNSASIARGAFAGAALGVEVVGGLLLAIVITFFFTKDSGKLTEWFLGLLGSDRADDARAVGRRISNTIGGYIRGILVVGLVDSALIAVALLILGVPLVLPLAILTFFGAFFPFVGAVLAGLLAALVALVTKGWVVALIVVGVTVVVQQVEGDVLAPLLIGKALRLHPLAVLLSLTGGALVGGIFGAFVAVPVVGSVAQTVEHFRGKDGKRSRTRS